VAHVGQDAGDGLANVEVILDDDYGRHERHVRAARPIRRGALSGC
jgi:hypothetical protein